MGKIRKPLYIEDLVAEIGSRSIVLVGAGRVAKSIVDKYEWNIKYAVDNDSTKAGTLIVGAKMSIPVFGWDYLRTNCETNMVLLLTPVYTDELVEIIRLDNALKNTDIFLYSYIWSIQWDTSRIEASLAPFDLTRSEIELIPRKLHYFWFSDNPYPDKIKRCIESWHKFCPDYEIIKWDLNNYQTENLFCNEALSLGRWAFASDYGRCDVLYRFGGIYLDSDVELIKPLDDLLHDSGFFCFESTRGVDPGSGMGSEKNNNILNEIRKKYDDIHFVNEDGSENRVNIIDQYTDVLKQHGLVTNGKYQIVEGMAVYPPLVLSPYSYRTGITSIYEKTFAVHHWESSWVTDAERKEICERKSYISSKVVSLIQNYIQS